jgi:hypothetical protein
MKEIYIVVDDIEYLVRSSDLRRFNVYSENRELFAIKRTEEQNIYYRWVTDTGYHSKHIERLGTAIHEQLLF